MSSPANDWDPKELWAAYAPNAHAPWDLLRVVHLHRRAGFAATWSELKRDLRDGPDKSIDRLLAGRSRETGIELFEIGTHEPSANCKHP